MMSWERMVRSASLPVKLSWIRIETLRNRRRLTQMRSSNIRMIPITVMLVFAAANAQDSEQDLRVDKDRIEERIKALSRHGRNQDGGVDRVAFSDADVAGRAYVQQLMREAGLEVKVDAGGNIIGRRTGRDRQLAPIMFGSHIDSVPGGGNYDGDVGSIGAIEVAQTLYENAILTRHPLEVIVFSDEESSFLGSRALIGEVKRETLELISHSGKTVAEGLKAIGGDPERLKMARRSPGDLTAFIELHIEQGAILHDEGVDIGVVEGIVGIRWWEITITGVANHAGTTPMNNRRDAMLTASELTLAINRIVTNEPGRQVGTVGRIRAEPGAPNVIPGKVVMSLELRDLSADKIEALFQSIAAEAEAIANNRGTKVELTELDGAATPTPTAPRLRTLIAEAARNLGLSFKTMPSGAGHDAQNVARITPTGMIFVPSIGGISHSPKEFTTPEDMANGANVLLHTVLAIDRSENEG